MVGVVGNTGAGKSSVINAMLDEERLVPTNCMRACTAVVTEILWNTSTDPSSKYRAEIEFISQADWKKELAVLMREFLSENGTLSREAQDPNSDAGIAWAKFHSVYPSIARDALGDCTIPSLMSKRSVVDVLGTTKKIRAARPQYFYQELQSYVDSKEKVAKKDKNKEKVSKPAFQTEYWPLIKVVKIYTKSDALSTGAVIVDLPGVHDSNAARAAVAQGHMKECTGLWIVAPINRAVDDKAAKTLLGDSFKRQRKYDGGFSSVTFICSKTDDISITEVIDSLGLEEDVTKFEGEQQRHSEEIKQIQNKLKDLSESREVYKLAISSAIEKHLNDMCKALQESMEAKANDIFMQMNRDYSRVLGGATGNQPVYLQSNEERELRSTVREILEGVDAQFEPIANGEIASEDAAMDATSDQGEEQIDVDAEDDCGIFDSAHESIENDVENATPMQSVSSATEQRSRMGTYNGEQVDMRARVEDEVEEEI